MQDPLAKKKMIQLKAQKQPVTKLTDPLEGAEAACRKVNCRN
jgi:hypothetical protein